MIRKFFIIFVLFMFLPVVGAAPTARMNVQVQSGQIRVTPTFLGKVLVTVSYGVSVEILQTKGDWMQVKAAQGQVGWMHKSALTTKRVSMSSGSSTAKSSASSDELALAGKGFNSDVEREYKAKNKNLNFAAVDRMEQVKIPATEMQAFLQAGAVSPAEGGAQ
jgi:uncharacterized protein YgiM (DUF1202 family)